MVIKWQKIPIPPPLPPQKNGERKRNVCMLSTLIHFCHTFLKQSVLYPTLCFNSLLVRVDFPTFGSPMIATFRVFAFSGWFGFSINFWSCSPLDSNNMYILNKHSYTTWQLLTLSPTAISTSTSDIEYYILTNWLWGLWQV